MPLLPKRRCRMGPHLFDGLKGERFFATVGTSCSRLKSVRQLRTQMTVLPTAEDWYFKLRLLTPFASFVYCTNMTSHDKHTVQYSWRDKSRWRTCTNTLAYRLNVCDNRITSFKSHCAACSVPSSLHKNYRTCTRKLETEVNVETKKCEINSTPAQLVVGGRHQWNESLDWFSLIAERWDVCQYRADQYHE